MYIWKKVLMAILAICCFLNQLNAEEKNYVINKGSFSLDFGNYIVTIDKWGVLKEVNVNGVVILKDGGIHSDGKYDTEIKGKDLRLYQGQREKDGFEYAKIIEKDGSLILQRNSILGNEVYPELILYSQEITFNPSGKIIFHYEIDITETLTWKGGFAYASTYFFGIPITEIKGKGYQITSADGNTTSGVIPLEWTKETGTLIGRIKEINVVTTIGSVNFIAGEKSNIEFTDSRSYKGSDLKFDVSVDAPWQRKQEVPKGTKLVIDFTAKFPVKGEGKTPDLP